MSNAWPSRREVFSYQKMNVLKDIITYAWRGSGKYVLLTCVVLSVITKLAEIAPIFGWIAVWLLCGYLCAIYFQMIQSSAVGGKEAPEFPDTSNIFEDIIWPMLQILVVGLVSFGPLIAYAIWAGEDHAHPVIGFALLGFGIVYFPMAMLAVVVLGYTGALSPHIVFPAIFRGGWLYWVGVLMLCLLYFVKGVIGDALEGSFIVGPLVMSVVSTYVMMTNARLLGVVYRERQEDFGWL